MKVLQSMTPNACVFLCGLLLTFLRPDRHFTFGRQGLPTNSLFVSNTVSHSWHEKDPSQQLAKRQPLFDPGTTPFAVVIRPRLLAPLVSSIGKGGRAGTAPPVTSLSPTVRPADARPPSVTRRARKAGREGGPDPLDRSPLVHSTVSRGQGSVRWLALPLGGRVGWGRARWLGDGQHPFHPREKKRPCWPSGYPLLARVFGKVELRGPVAGRS